jgi:NTP pyrophosphatase (non-canonical NTP hydrolase)
MESGNLISLEAWVRIRQAAEHAQNLHGDLTLDQCRCSTILTEETGEVARAVLQIQRRYQTSPGTLLSSLGDLRQELAQVAATAALWLENLERLERLVEKGAIDAEEAYNRCTGGAIWQRGQGTNRSVSVPVKEGRLGSKDRER